METQESFKYMDLTHGSLKFRLCDQHTQTAEQILLTCERTVAKGLLSPSEAAIEEYDLANPVLRLGTEMNRLGLRKCTRIISG